MGPLVERSRGLERNFGRHIAQNGVGDILVHDVFPRVL